MALRFEDLESRKTAETMTLLIYKSLQNCSDFGFNNQIQRASLSVMNNIAE